VAFFDGANVIGAVPLFDDGARLETSSLTVGPHAFSAVYGGDATDAPSASMPVAEEVDRIAATVALTAPSRATAGTPITVQASVGPSEATGVPTGTVTFYDGSYGSSGDYTERPMGEAQLSNGVATLTTSLPAGDHALVAVYHGDARYAPATSPSTPVEVYPAIL
jgi:hypothetical protein